MKHLFKSTMQDQLLRSFSMAYLLLERSLKIRSKGKVTLREAFVVEVIDRIKGTGKNTPSEIGKVLTMSLPALSPILRSLIKKNYIKKVLSYKDNRVYYLELTTVGKQFVENNIAYRSEMVNNTFGFLNLFSDFVFQKLADKVEEFVKADHLLLDALEAQQSKPKKKPREDSLGQ